MDRFLMKISMGSLSAEEERRMIDRYIVDEPLAELTSVCTLQEIKELQKQCREVFVHNDLRDYIVALIQGTRNMSGGTAMGVSPRGTLAFLHASQGYALVQGRNYVVPEDIKKLQFRCWYTA